MLLPSLGWASDELLWPVLLGLDDNCGISELQMVKVEKSVECLLPYLERLVDELRQVLELEGQKISLGVDWYVQERCFIGRLNDILSKIDTFLSNVYTWCVKLEDLKLCSHLKCLTLRTFDAQQYVGPLLRKCILASRLIEIEQIQLHALLVEMSGCAAELIIIQTRLRDFTVPTNKSLQQVFDQIRSNDITYLCGSSSYLHGNSATLASLSVFSDLDTSTFQSLQSLQSLSYRIDALKFSMKLFTQQVTEFQSSCVQFFPESSNHLLNLSADLAEKWAGIQADYAERKSALLDKSCNTLFTFLITETLSLVRGVAAQFVHQQSHILTEQERLDMKLCSGVINFIRNAFKEELITRSDLANRYNDVLLREWNSLNQAFQASEAVPVPILETHHLSGELLSPFTDHKTLTPCKTPEFLRKISLNKEHTVPFDMETPGTSPHNSLAEDFECIPSKSLQDMQSDRLVGLGLDLGLEFNQSPQIPLSAVKKDRIISFKIDYTTEKGANLSGKLVTFLSDIPKLGPAVALSRSDSMSNAYSNVSGIPTIVPNFNVKEFPRIIKMDASGSKIPVLSASHGVLYSSLDHNSAAIESPYKHKSPHEMHNNSDEFSFLEVSESLVLSANSLENSVMYTNLRTPPGFILNTIKDTSTPQMTVQKRSNAAKAKNASYCLGLMTPNNTLGSVSERYSPGVLDWGSRPSLRQKYTSAAVTSTSRHTKRPWK